MPFFDPVDRTATPPPFGLELYYLPAVRSVAFELAQGGVPWFVIMKCLDHPNLTSISIDEESTWRCTTPLSIPPDLSLHGCRLTEFTYTTSQWRETESRIRGTDLQPTYTQESIYLRALVLAMSDTAESLTLPVETAPLFEMAATDWPRLRMLSLIGEYTHPDQCRAIPLLLPRMPYLRSLSVKIIQREGTRHPRLLQALPETSFRLRSLAVSYPDPADPIFSCIGDGLTSLSLCDSPRHYFQSRYSSESSLAIFPTLTSSECLTILKRISAPQLSILELVYEADAAEDELLRYLSRAFPLLQELELHRYPVSSEDAVPYVSFVHTASSPLLTAASAAHHAHADRHQVPARAIPQPRHHRGCLQVVEGAPQPQAPGPACPESQPARAGARPCPAELRALRVRRVAHPRALRRRVGAVSPGVVAWLQRRARLAVCSVSIPRPFRRDRR